MADDDDIKPKKKIGLKGGLLLTVACLLGVMFIPIAVVLIVGMAPTVVAGMIDKSEEKLKAITVGFMNFAGCYPFLLTLVARHGNDPEVAFNIIFQPLNIVVMYMAAGAGYLIEFGIITAVSGFLKQSAQKRIKEIAEEQKDMVKRWGEEVTGDIPLDAYGFPLKKKEEEQSAEKSGNAPATADGN